MHVYGSAAIRERNRRKKRRIEKWENVEGMRESMRLEMEECGMVERTENKLQDMPEGKGTDGKRERLKNVKVWKGRELD